MNSVSIELLLSLLQLLLLLLLLATHGAAPGAAPGDVAARGARVWLGSWGGWNKEEGEKVMFSDELLGGLNKEV